LCQEEVYPGWGWLHYPGIGRNTADGLGTLFTKQTGLDARDPATERRQIEWSMD
jgi:hypothetical protein